MTLNGDDPAPGECEGGSGAVERYYRDQGEILERHQLFGASDNISRSGRELLMAVGRAVQR